MYAIIKISNIIVPITILKLKELVNLSNDPDGLNMVTKVSTPW